MNRGIRFKIPNSYGSYLGQILEPMDVTQFNWFIGGEESYYVVDDTLQDSLFPELVVGMNGEELREIVDHNKYYLIFANLKAYPKGAEIIDVTSYEEYMMSECQMILLVIDSVYVDVYCKDLNRLKEFYDHIKRQGFDSLVYITDENDTRDRLSVW